MTGQKVIIPRDLISRHPVNDEAKERIKKHRSEISAILHGKDPRKLAIVGPCSLDNSGAIFEFVERLSAQATQLEDRIKIVFRMPPLKPRTTAGWRGLESESLPAARSALTQIANSGHAVAIELLSPNQGVYYGDILSLQWIGARNVTDQNVRLQASSMPEIPTLVKNGIFGDMITSAQAIFAINSEHDSVHLLDDDGQFTMSDTEGGDGAGIILRGAQTADGRLEHNITVAATKAALEVMEKLKQSDLGVICDVSHGNGAGFSEGAKSAAGQEKAVGAVLELMRDKQVGSKVRGVMMESYLHTGTTKDAPTKDTYGYSLTDPTLNIEKTIDLLAQLAEVVS